MPGGGSSRKRHATHFLPKGKSRSTSKAERAVVRQEANPQRWANRVGEVLSEVLGMRRGEVVFDTRSAAEMKSLAEALWSRNYAVYRAGLSHANPEFVRLLDSQWEEAEDGELFGFEPPRMLAWGKARWEGVLSSIFRSRSRNLVPFSTAAQSVRLHYNSVPGFVWSGLRMANPSVAMSRQWTVKFVDLAMTLQPPPHYKFADRISACCFDNFRIHAQHGSFYAAGSGGESIDMINYASLGVPHTALPAGWDFAKAISGALTHAAR